MAKILIINGPNLNMLGIREPEIYGSETLEDIKKLCEDEAANLVLDLDFRQSNSESEIIGWIQASTREYDGIIINAAAYSHTSIAIMDALLAVNIPTVEVHLSNIFKREDFRHNSYISKAVNGVICGFGGKVYTLALRAIVDII